MTQAKRPTRAPKFIRADLVHDHDGTHCLLLNDHRIAGGSTCGAKFVVYSWSLQLGTLLQMLRTGCSVGVDEVFIEVFRHRNDECSVYLAKTLLPARAKGDCRGREADSKRVLSGYAHIADFAQAHAAFESLLETAACAVE